MVPVLAVGILGQVVGDDGCVPLLTLGKGVDLLLESIQIFQVILGACIETLLYQFIL